VETSWAWRHPPGPTTPGTKNVNQTQGRPVSVNGCTATWTREIAAGISAGWAVKFVGTGLGSDGGESYVESASFEARNGQTKLIYCPLAVQLEHLEIRDRNAPPVQRWRIDLTKATGGPLAPGLKRLKQRDVPERGALVEPRWQLAGDPSRSLARYERTYTTRTVKKVRVGFKVQGTELGLTASSDYSSGVKVSYAVRTGADYDLFYVKDYDGFLCASSA
jgi:hypothetical protein